MSSSKEEVLEQFLLPSRLERLNQVAENRTNSLTVVLEEVHNPHNISAVIRSADAFGVNKVHFIGSSLDYSRGISLGTERWIRTIKHKSATDAVKVLKDDGFSLVVMQPELDEAHNGQKKSIPINELPFSEKLALVFGNEHKGVSEELVKAADYSAFIPMYGFVESLNISVACAISLFCSTISDAKNERQTKKLGDTELRELKNEWLKKDLKGSKLILERFKSVLF